jgi:hypothetical protein
MWSATTNQFIRDNSTWRYIGNIINVQPGTPHVFIRSHTSVGYERFDMDSREGALLCPLDFGYATTITALEDLDSARATHMQKTHRWGGTQCVHARAQRDPSNWRTEAPLRKMRLFAPSSLRLCAIKLAAPRNDITLQEGWALTQQSRVHYAFDSIAPHLTEACVEHIIKDEHREGSCVALSREDCTKMGITERSLS